MFDTNRPRENQTEKKNADIECKESGQSERQEYKQFK